MRTQHQVVELVPLTVSDGNYFSCQVKKTISSVVENLQVAVDITKDKTPAGQCKANQPSLWRMEQGRKEPVVAKHGLSSKSWLLFPSGSPAPQGVEVDTWYNVSVPVVTVTTKKQTPTDIKENKEKEVETELFFDLVKPSVVGVGVELPPNAVLSVRRCPTGQFNVRNEAGTYFREKGATNQKTHWGSIRADKLLDDNQWGDFAKMFVSSKSQLHDDLFGCEENGELLFLIIEHCNEFINFSSFFPDVEERKKFCQSLRVGTSSEECGNTLPSFAKMLREKRNSFAHELERMRRAPNDAEIQEYQKIIESAKNFLDAVQTILKRVNDEEGCILADEKDLHTKAVEAIDAAKITLVELRNSGASMNDQMLAELIRIVKETGTDREIKDDKIRQLLHLADVNMSHSLCSLVTQSGGFLHAFLSEGKTYSEHHESQKLLFESMYLEAAKTPGLGPHCDGFPWPKHFSINWKDFKVPHVKSGQQNKNTTTLTGLRLLSDISMSSYERHADAISKSMMYIPVFTSESLQQFVQQDSDPADANNFLFQLILARELHETSKIMTKHHSSSVRNLYPCALLRPIFLLRSSEIDDLQSKLRLEPMQQLQRRARQQLEGMGLKVFEQDCLSPHGLLNYYKDKKCYMVDDERPGQSSKDTAAIVAPLLTEIRVEIQNLYMESMAYNFPQSAELVKFLSDASISRYGPILARHAIHSVQSFSTLDAATGCLASVAKEAAKISHFSAEVESKLLHDAIAIAKKSHLSQPIKVQFDNYVDQDASLLTSVFSGSALDTSFAQKTFLLLMFLFGSMLMFVSMLESRAYQSECQGQGEEIDLIDFWSYRFLMGSCLVIAVAVAKFSSPKSVKWVFFSFCTLRIICVLISMRLLFVLLQECSTLEECCHPFYNFGPRERLQYFTRHSYIISVYADYSVNVVFSIFLAASCILKQNMFLHTFCLNHGAVAFLKIVTFAAVGAPTSVTLWALSVYYIFIIVYVFFLACTLYGRHRALEILNLESQYLNREYDKINTQKSNEIEEEENNQFKQIQLNPDLRFLQDEPDIDQLFRDCEFINNQFQV